MKPLKNWDNNTWLSSKKYIQTFNKFLLNQVKLDHNSTILDVGCGRGGILANLSNKLRLLNKPIGIDIENHKDKSKKIIFKKTDVLSFIVKFVGVCKYSVLSNTRGSSESTFLVFTFVREFSIFQYEIE